MEHTELGGELKKDLMEENKEREIHGLGGASPGIEGLERTLGIGRREDLGFSGPVRADQLGAEFDVQSYPVMTRARLGSGLGGAHVGGGTHFPRAEFFFSNPEGISGKGKAEVEALMRTLIEGRCLALSKGPNEFTGEQPAAWIAQMDLFLDRNHVPEAGKLRVALSYLDEDATKWYSLLLNEEERPYDWKGLKVMLLEQFGGYDLQGAIKRLRKVKQAGPIKEYLMRFNNVVADCPTLSSEDKLKYFIEGLDPEIRRFVYVCRPGTMSEAIKLATYLWDDVDGSRKERGESSGWRKGSFHRPNYAHVEPNTRGDNRGWLRAPDPNPRYGVMWKPSPFDRGNPPPLSPGRGIINHRRPENKFQCQDFAILP